MPVKNKEQIYKETVEYLETKLVQLEKQKVELDKQIEETRNLLEKMPIIYGYSKE